MPWAASVETNSFIGVLGFFLRISFTAADLLEPDFRAPFVSAAAAPSVTQPHSGWLLLRAWIGLPHLGQGLLGKAGFFTLSGLLLWAVRGIVGFEVGAASYPYGTCQRAARGGGCSAAV